MVALEPVVQILGLSMLELRRDRAVPLQIGDRLTIGWVPIGVDARGIQSRERFRAAPRKRLAALVSRRSVSMKSSVAPSLSIARYRYFQRPFTRT